MLISPAEPKPLWSLGTVSSTPEEYGSDFLFHIKDLGIVGIQRKEFGDLVNSVYDGRLGKELSQMKRLARGLFILEGNPKWTNDGNSLGRGNFTLTQYRGVLLRIQLENYWIIYTENLEDTLKLLAYLEKWFHQYGQKEHLSSLNKKSEVKDAWGRSGNREWAMSVLMCFGMGPTLASRVYEELGLPLGWTVEKEEFLKIQGIGKSRADKIVRSLENGN